MLSEERREKIKGLLESCDSLSIQNLAAKFEVSTSTIRRDLNRLAQKKVLRRTRGGAMSSNRVKMELNFEAKKTVNLEEKKEIGIIASKLINDGDIIFVESGTTCMQLCYNLADKKNLTIITNSCNIAITANRVNPEFKIFLTGGYFKPDTRSLIGHVADYSIENFTFEKAFIGITAIDLKEGITTVDYAEAHTKSLIIEKSHKAIGLVDSSKFGNICLNCVCPIKSIDTIVTNNNSDKDFISQIIKFGTEVLIY